MNTPTARKGRGASRGALLRAFLVASLAFGSSLAQNSRLTPTQPGDAGETLGVPWTGDRGITETVAEIMGREARAPKMPVLPYERKPFLRRLTPPRENPSAPAVSQWPPLEEAGAAVSDQTQGFVASGVAPLSPQPVGTKFKAISLLSPSESQFVPPDSMGDVSPTQILAAANGRIKVFDKTGALGGLNVTDGVFFSSVSGGAGITDPQIRYDRLSGRWFVTEVTTTYPNRILIAVSNGPTITSASSFTFFQFQHDLAGPTPNSDTGQAADYDSLGVDRFALYIGVNVFNSALTTFIGSTGFVVNKANLLGGALTVTAFRQLGTGTAPGPWAPRGVSNDDPAATQGRSEERRVGKECRL